ncbi:unnamed protein product [Euphydryas editha]|uniref:Nuclease HARBI1 n=1 Tax=Euphydryas editha TaxID=104508 RepID=A0AAU9VBH2_EUPED|nr:unnamed protein product [Euphydryas editha]
MQALHSLDVIQTMEQLEHSTRRRKVYRISDSFSLDDVDFPKRYRFKKSTANYIINLVRDDLNLDRRGFETGQSPEIQFLTAIRCSGRREVQEDAGDHHGLSQVTTSRICVRVARALARHSASFFKMPTTFAEEERNMR